jgi:hypothetical protein
MAIRPNLLIIGTGLAAVLLLLVIQGSLTDDSYITLDYARNLALHLHWGLIPQETANTATSPLFVALIAVVTALTRLFGHEYPIFAWAVVSVGGAMLFAWAWLRVVRALRLPLAAASLGIALVLLNPFLLSALGLEVQLIPPLLALLAAMALEGRPVWFGVAAGVCLLARVDLAVFAVAIGASSPWIRRHWLRALAAAAVVTTPWFLFSWIHLGSAVPDTVLIKSAKAAEWSGWTYFTGPLMYAKHWHGAAGIGLLPGIAGGFALLVWVVLRITSRRAFADALPMPIVALGLGGLAYYAVYSLENIGPYHWYYVAPLASLSMFLSCAIGVWLGIARLDRNLRPGAATAATAVLGLLAGAAATLAIAHGVPWREPEISTNRATPGDYARVGKALRSRVGSAAVQSPGELGTLVYYCRCRILDQFSDRGYLVEIFKTRVAHAGFAERALLNANYAFLDRRPRPPRIDYYLTYGQGRGAGPRGWAVRSAWDGPGFVKLVAADPRRGER